METRVIEVGEARIHAEASGTGAPVVLIHAGITDRRMWDPQIPALEEGYRVVRYDARGYGNTLGPLGPYAPHEDLFAVMDAFGIARAHLVGGSMGGATAIDAALAQHERVAGLVLAAPGLAGYSFTDAPTVSRWPIIEAAYEKGDYDRVVELEMEMWVAGPRRRLADVDPRIVEKVRTMLRASYPESAKFELRHPDPPAIERLAAIEAPTLVVVGDADVPDMLRIADTVAAQVPRALKVVMSEVAHLPNMERAAKFNALVLGHLEHVTEERA
jgi:pimeloyl-ACP methyl ester carboxylesterase